MLLCAFSVRFPAIPQPYLWLDEAWRAYSIASTHSPSSLIEYAAQEHLIFLLSEWVLGKIGLLVFGKTELAFRIWPLLFALLGLVGVYLFLSRVSTSAAALLATLLISLGYGFIRHSREFKPYALDLTLTAWTLYAAVRIPLHQREQKNILLVFMLHLFAVSSLVFAFVFPAVVAYRFRQTTPRTVFDFLLIVSPIVVFFLTYLFFFRPQMSDAALQRFWAAYFANSPEQIAFLIGEGDKFITQFFPLGGFVGILFYCVLLPLLSLRNRDGVWLLLLVSFGVQIVASAVGLYPLFHRPSYYLYGLIVIAFAYVVGALSQELAKKSRLLQDVLGICAIVGIVGYLVSTILLTQAVKRVRAWPSEQGRAAFSVLADRFESGDILKINYAAYFPFQFYKDIAFHSNPALMAMYVERHHALNDRTRSSLCHTFKAQSADISVGDRVWFLTTHVDHAYQHYVAVLSQMGQVRVIVGDMHQGLIVLEVTQSPAKLVCYP